jgi:hypothetical protein
MTTKLLASGIAAITAVGAAATGMTPVAMASTGPAGIHVQPVTGTYALDTPSGGGGGDSDSSLNRNYPLGDYPHEPPGLGGGGGDSDRSDGSVDWIENPAASDIEKRAADDSSSRDSSPDMGSWASDMESLIPKEDNPFGSDDEPNSSRASSPNPEGNPFNSDNEPNSSTRPGTSSEGAVEDDDGYNTDTSTRAVEQTLAARSRSTDDGYESDSSGS